MTKFKIVEVPSIKTPIMEAPGFQKKELAHSKLDLMALCGFSCSYCSSNSGNYLRINRERFADLTEAQTGERTYPSDDPALTFTWPDVLPKLRGQIARHPRSWGAGKTLVVSMLTDAFSPLALANGTTEAALTAVMEGTSFRVRVLTKGAVVGSPKWIEFFQRWAGRFVVGLSIGTLDDEWARRVEIGTSSPTARLAALRRLQDAGVPTFGMLCPVFPDMLEGDALERLLGEIRPSICEKVWFEPYNSRGNWREVQSGYVRGTLGWEWFEDAFGKGGEERWSNYATILYRRVRRVAEVGGWLDRMAYLLYESSITSDDASRLFFADLKGVLLQGKPDPATKLSTHPIFAMMQREIAADAERAVSCSAGPLFPRSDP